MSEMTPDEWTLMVSQDTGSHYFPHLTTKTREGLLAEAHKMDEEGWRWYITAPDGTQSNDVCARHAAILAFMDTLNRNCKEKKP
jgi:hypothetical protein